MTVAREAPDPYEERKRYVAQEAAKLPEPETWHWWMTADTISTMERMGRISPGHAHALAAAVARQ